MKIMLNAFWGHVTCGWCWFYPWRTTRCRLSRNFHVRFISIMTVFFVKYHLLFDHSFWSKSSLKVLLTILLLSRLIIFSTIDWMRNRELMNFWLIIVNILLTLWLLVLICSKKLDLNQMIPSFLLLEMFMILLVRLIKTYLIWFSFLLVLLCLLMLSEVSNVWLNKLWLFVVCRLPLHLCLFSSFFVFVFILWYLFLVFRDRYHLCFNLYCLSCQCMSWWWCSGDRDG